MVGAGAGRVTVGQQEDDLLLDAGEDALVEQDQPHPLEAAQQELAHRCGVVDAQQLRGQDEPHPPADGEEGGGVHDEGRPRGGQGGEPDPLGQCGPARPGAGGAPEVLVSDVGRVADDGPDRAGGAVVEEVGHGQAGAQARFTETTAGPVHGGGVQVHAGELTGGRDGAELAQPGGGGPQEDGLAAGGLEDRVVGVAQRPAGDEGGQRFGGEEGSSRLAKVAGVDVLHGLSSPEVVAGADGVVRSSADGRRRPPAAPGGRLRRRSRAARPRRGDHAMARAPSVAAKRPTGRG